jgi:predicted DNA-binding transcriptional regulator AlpA
MKTQDKPYLTTKEAADILGYSEQTLAQSRNSKTLGGTEAPPHIKNGRMVRYSRAELDAWLTGGVWAVYELEKAKIPVGISEVSYNRQIKAITDRLGI